MTTAMIYKVLTPDDWRAFQQDKQFHGSAHDQRDGFLHFSAADQLAATLAKHYGGQAELRLLEVGSTGLGDALKWETSRDGALFPHLYASLSLEQIGRTWELSLAQDGGHILPADL
jgi:uncharacterized protein (DUF952 family)